MTPATTGIRDRMTPWLDALRTRGRALPAPVRPAFDTVIVHLDAVRRRHAGDVVATLSDDLVVRSSGWTLGGTWSLTGSSARADYAATLARVGDRIVSHRVDIDRFFPGVGVVGFDGDHSFITAPADLDPALRCSVRLAAGADLDDALDGASGLLVVRRVACFATVQDDRISAIDLFWSVHPSVYVSDASDVRRQAAGTER